MDIYNIPSVQRVVNFTPNNGKMLRAEQPQPIMPGLTMICDLPLLFMNGLPTCLENLSLDQLENFVPYMISSSGSSPTVKPKWWPHDMDFSISPARKSDMTDSKWLLTLKNLVLSCYSHHGCDYALRLCAKKSHECHNEWTLVDGLDGTMYLYNKVTRKISTTFENANITCSRTKRTFSNNTPANKNANYVKMRRNNSPIQIYLCGTCNTEFRSLNEMQVHEKGCSKKCSMSVLQNQENISDMYKSRFPIRAHTRDLRIPKVSTLDQSSCFSRHLKNQTGRKALNLADHNKSREIHTHVRKRYKNNFVSAEEVQSHDTHKPSFNCGNELSMSNTASRFSVSLVRSSSRRMSLMPRKIRQEELSKNKSETNIYLCDKCDGEFSSFSDVQHHDTYCKDRTETTSSPVVSTSEADNTQECFLKYFHLTPSSLLKPCLESRGKPLFRNPIRYNSIPISSPLGYLIHGRSRVPTAAISSKIEKVERYCSAKPGEVYKPFGTKQNTVVWSISWKSRKATTENSKHTYLYPTQRWWEMPLIRKMKMKEEKKLRLLRICKSVRVSVRKLSDEEVENYTCCRKLSVRVNKLTFEEIHYKTNMYVTKTPILKKLLSEELVVYETNNTISPNKEKLSFKKMDKYTKPIKTLCDVTHQITNAGLVSVKFKGNSSSKTIFCDRLK